jgi:hypothetical protein
LFIYLSTKLVKLKIVFLREKLEHFDYFRTDGLAIINYWKKKQSLMPAATPCSIANSITAAAGGNRT